MNFFLFYQKKRRNVSSFFFLGHSSGHFGADGQKRWDVFSAHRGRGRQAAFCAGQAALPEAGALPEGVFSPGLAFSRGLWGIFGDFWGDFLGAGGDLFGPPGRCFTTGRRKNGGIRPEAAPDSGVRGGAGPMPPRFASRPPGAGRPHLTPHRPLPIMLVVVF